MDNYYYEGKRTAVFLGEKVTKFHRTLTTYLNTLLSNGFIINHIVEPQPPEYMMDIPGMQDEMRRPMMLIVSANKKWIDRTKTPIRYKWRIWMKLFLCSHFSSVGSLIKEEIDNKKVAFIPTASLREGYIPVMSARLESYSINWEQP